ncbi:hypothetical protein LTS08_003325 [Lithohypha guttulata]|uniref:uncharacterized protein n=1 Tax=Lithohypha guttulata TaxID=1690604 RepID=UPI002DE151DE|nr:hypothetical protein LTR51_000017 [Lithohypha guttulata]KAK5103902.1 hypothetical protein LTS08_003325 [Lithohypha guttulata]
MANNNFLPPSFHDLQETISYQFSNSRYLLEALRTAGAGYHGANSPSAIDGNKRLAHLGEAILKMLLLEDWYMAGANRETASVQIARIASPSYLCHVADAMQLQPCILTNPSQWNQPLSPNMVSKAVQALVGAIWLDSGRNLDELRRVLQEVHFWDADQVATE